MIFKCSLVLMFLMVAVVLSEGFVFNRSSPSPAAVIFLAVFAAVAGITRRRDGGTSRLPW